MVGRPILWCGSGRETLSEVLTWLGDPPGGPEVVGRPSRRSGSGREILRRSVSGRENHPEVRK